VNAALSRIAALVAAGRYRVSEHAYDELINDGILIETVVGGLAEANLVEDYSDAMRGPSILVLSFGKFREAVHAVWGISRKQPDVAVLITAYHPDPARWSPDFLARRKR
jgi:hypothetical protein